MEFIPLLLFCSVSLLFLLLGILFARGKGAWLISGYNTMSPAEKEKYDEKALCRGMSRLMYTLAAAWLLPSAGVALGSTPLVLIGTVIFVAVTVGAAILFNTGNRFRK